MRYSAREMAAPADNSKHDAANAPAARRGNVLEGMTENPRARIRDARRPVSAETALTVEYTAAFALAPPNRAGRPG